LSKTIRSEVTRFISMTIEIIGKINPNNSPQPTNAVFFHILI